MIDISWLINEKITTYKNRKFVKYTPTKTFKKDKVRETKINLQTHIGTHIDAPSHILKKGKTIDKIRPVIGKCKVLDFTKTKEKITKKDLEKEKITKGDIILLKTKNSKRKLTEKFDKKFIYLDYEGALYLTKKKISAVGIDALGIERDQPKHKTHISLLQNNITIIEGLRLNKVKPGKYQLICMPLLLENLDGAPARAILL